MDLLQTVRKEGSRGGRGDFTWDDVKADQHREHYLGHSLMAPVGRWQKGRDLSWYSKSSAPPTDAARQSARAEELRRIKEAEAEAMAAALGLPVSKPVTSSNAIPVSSEVREGEIRKAVDDVAEKDATSGNGLGFGSYSGAGIPDNEDEVLPGTVRGRESRSDRNDKRERGSKYDRRPLSGHDADEYERRHKARRRDDRRDDRTESLRVRNTEHRNMKRRRGNSRSRSRSRSRTRHDRRTENGRYRDHRELDYRERFSDRKEADNRRERRARSNSESRISPDKERYRSYERRYRSPPRHHSRRLERER